MSGNCPRCAKPLEDQQMDEMTFRCCRDCKGMLLRHPDLVTILEKSWHAVSPEAAETMTFHAKEGWQSESAYSCPDCHQPMEKYGYMGLAAIQMDRCDACELVWLDADELQNMLLALAQSNYRSESLRQKSERERVDIVEMSVQGTGAMWDQFNRRGAWVFQNNNVGVVAAQVLLSLLLK